MHGNTIKLVLRLVRATDAPAMDVNHVQKFARLLRSPGGFVIVKVCSAVPCTVADGSSPLAGLRPGSSSLECTLVAIEWYWVRQILKL